MHSARFSVAVLSAILILLWSIPSLAQLPPLFEGELNVCNRVNQERAKGLSLEQAIQSVIGSVQPEESISLESLQRTVIHHAIRTCRYDPSVVVTAAYRAGVPLPVVAGSAEEAGAGRDVITAALVQAGANVSAVQAAFVRAETPEPSVNPFPSSPFEVGGGLGQASPFNP
jgi:hypothetical protein